MESLQITKIKRKSARSPYWLVEFSDGGEPVELHSDVYFRAHWFEGMVLEQSDVEEMIDRQDRSMCRSSAWRLISKRPRSRLELARSLNRRFPKKVVQQTLDDLEEKNHISDRAYGELLIRELMNKGAGVQQVRLKAHQKGLTKDLVEEMLEKHLNPDQQQETARAVLEKWCNRSKKYPSPMHRKQAAAQHLARRGYEADLVWQLVGELVGDQEEIDG